MSLFPLLRFPFAVVGTVIDTLLTARAVVRHGEMFAAWAEPSEGLVEFEAEHEVHEPRADQAWTDGRVELPREHDLAPRRWAMPDGSIVGEAVNREAIELLKADPDEYFRRTRLSWGVVAETYREALAEYCLRRGGSYTGEHTCLRDFPAGEDAVPPAAPPAGLNPPAAPDAGEGPVADSGVPPAARYGAPTSRVATSELLYQGAVYADLCAALVDGSDQGDLHPYRVQAREMRERADAFQAIEDTA